MIFEERARDRTIFLQVCDPCSFEIFDYVRKKIIYKKPWIRLFDPFSISLRGFIFGKSSISSKKKIVCSKSKFSFLCKRYNRFLHDSFYKKNNFIDSNSNCLFQNTFVPLRSIKIQNYTYPFSHNEKEKERGKYSYTNLFSPILRAFARCVLRGDDGGDDSKGTRETSSGVSTSCCLERAPRIERGVGEKKKKKTLQRVDVPWYRKVFQNLFPSGHFDISPRSLKRPSRATNRYTVKDTEKGTNSKFQNRGGALLRFEYSSSKMNNGTRINVLIGYLSC